MSNNEKGVSPPRPFIGGPPPSYQMNHSPPFQQQAFNYGLNPQPQQFNYNTYYQAPPPQSTPYQSISPQNSQFQNKNPFSPPPPPPPFRHINQQQQQQQYQQQYQQPPPLPQQCQQNPQYQTPPQYRSSFQYQSPPQHQLPSQYQSSPPCHQPPQYQSPPQYKRPSQYQPFPLGYQQGTQFTQGINYTPNGVGMTQKSSGLESSIEGQPAAKVTKIDFSSCSEKWTETMFERSDDFDFCKMLQLPWDPVMWKKFYDSYAFKRDFKMLSNLVELLFRSTEQFLHPPYFVAQLIDQSSAKISAPSCHHDEPSVYFRYPDSPELPEDLIFPNFIKTPLYVVNADVLDIATKLPENDTVIVNICNPLNLWKRDQGKSVLRQEEAILTRTSLSHALASVKYPIPDYACVYVSNVALNRSGLEDGFTYYSEPKKLNIISMADNVTTSGGDSKESLLQQLRVKFEIILRACIHNGKRRIVIPPFGCYSCNPSDSAAILKAVLMEFAGCFIGVYFAISSHYYSDEIINMYAKELAPQENNEIKKDFNQSTPFILRRQEGKSVFYMKSKGKLCPRAGKCTNPKLSHFKEYLHPPVCQDPKCPNRNSIVHATMFAHMFQCKNIDNCESYLEYSVLKQKGENPDENLCYHIYRFTHKPLCPAWDSCNDSSPEHVKTYFHKLSCPFGLDCPKKGDPDHDYRFVHNNPQCPHGVDCLLFADKNHTQQFVHPFLPFCPMAPYCCHDKSSDHQESFSHICYSGPCCSDRKDPEHSRKFIHIGIECPDGDACDDISEEHLGMYFHPKSVCKAPSIRKKCYYPECAIKDPNHLRKFRHYWYGKNITMSMLNVKDPENPSKYMFSCMNRNVINWNEKMDSYLGGRLNTNTQNFNDIVEWFRSMRPNHMCDVNVFISILDIGCYASLELLKNFWVKPKDLLETIMSSPRMEILKKGYDWLLTKESIVYIKKYVKKAIPFKQIEIKSKYTNASTSWDLIDLLGKTPPTSEKKYMDLKELRITMEKKFDGIKPFLDILDDVINVILNSIISLFQALPGVQNKANKYTKTNHTVFTIVGPHYGNYGRGEVVMVLKKEVMNHPDFYMCPCCSLFYSSGKHAYGRPWIKPKAVNSDGYSDDFLSDKFSRCSEGWEIVAAKEWIARTASSLGKKVSNVTLDDVKSYCKIGHSVNSIEGHLPCRVPFDYTEHIILTRGAYEQLRASGFGRALIEFMETKHSKDFFTITSGSTQEETEEYLLKHPIPASECKTGMTFNVYDENEIILPLYIFNDKNYITFSAKGKFYATLATKPGFDDKGRDVVTISPINGCTGLAAWFFVPSVCLENNEVSKCDFFNLACPYNDFVQYCIFVDKAEKTITVTHWGPSSAFSCAKLDIYVGKTLDEFCYLTFAGKKDDDGEYVTILDLNISTDEPNRALEPKTFISPKKPQVPNDLPICEKPFECPIMYNTKNPNYSTHIKKCRHVCKYGKEGCREFNDPEHRKVFMHLDKPACPQGPKCAKLADPTHRLLFYHSGFLDYLFPCKHGEGCWNKDVVTGKHCMEYHHDPKFKFPDKFEYV